MINTLPLLYIILKENQAQLNLLGNAKGKPLKTDGLPYSINNR